MILELTTGCPRCGRSIVLMALSVDANNAAILDMVRLGRRAVVRPCAVCQRREAEAKLSREGGQPRP